MEKQGYQVILAADKNLKDFFKRELPGLPFEHLPDISLTYPRHSNLFLHLLPKVIFLMNHIRKENKQLALLVKKHRPTIIISDNRYGCYSPDVHNICITHQLNPILPILWKIFQPLARTIIKILLRKFDEIWIPDHRNTRISGKLSHNNLPDHKVSYTGPLSRFKKKDPSEKTLIKEQILIILSGPEPQRTILEEKLTKILSGQNLKTIIIRGCPSDKYAEGKKSESNIQFHDHAGTQELQSLILESKYIICRSGYSTMMDLLSLNRSALLIPTPGQSEQEYLAKHGIKKGWFVSCRQKDLSADLLNKQFEQLNSKTNGGKAGSYDEKKK
jgi:UDP-N-acetylglucosamine:LPS N-acetylglucosamine transferase